MMQLIPYPEYKDSGVPWLGKIPAHWGSAKLGQIGKSFKTGPFGSILHQSDYVAHGIPIVNPAHMINGRIRPNPHRTISPETFERLSEYGLVENDIVFSRRGELGRCALVTAEEHGYLLGTGSIRVRLRENLIDPKYLLKSYQARWVGDLLSSLSVGATMESLNTGILRQLPALIPTAGEQTQIVRFLGCKTAQINKFIRNKRRLIDLLKEQKRNIVNQAVTRGLDANAKFKPSGVEWIGDIPEHWEAMRLKQCISWIEQGWSPQCDAQPAGENDWGVLKVGCVNGEALDTNQNKKLPNNLNPIASLSIKAGDILVSRANTRELLGLAAHATTDYPRILLCDKLFRFHVRNRCAYPAYLVLAIRSPASRAQIESSANGASSSMQNIGQGVIRNLWISLPSVYEQERILSFIQEATGNIDQTITRAQREIELMREYRTRLIADVVTGQVDVRGIEVPEVAEPKFAGCGHILVQYRKFYHAISC